MQLVKDFLAKHIDTVSDASWDIGEDFILFRLQVKCKLLFI